MIRILSIVILVLFSGWSMSQSIYNQLAPNKMIIGDPIELQMQVTIGVNQIIQWPETKKNWPVFPLEDSPNLDNTNSNWYLETISNESIDTIAVFGDSLKVKWEIKVTAWDSMMAYFPPVSIMIDNQTYSTEPLVFSADFPAVQQGVEMFDIFEAFSDVSSTENPLWYWGGRIGLLLVFLGLLFYLYKRFFGKTAHVISTTEKSLRDRTIIALDALLKSKMYESNLKEYYFELSMILRRFLSATYEDSYLELTTYEIKYRLQSKALTIEQIQQIVAILQQSDLVKFAKNKPTDLEVMNQTADVKRLIYEISELKLPDKKNE